MSVERGYGDSVEPSTRAQGERYFRAILTDPQIEALEVAVTHWLETPAADLPTSEEERANARGGLVALQTAEVIVP